MARKKSKETVLRNFEEANNELLEFAENELFEIANGYQLTKSDWLALTREVAKQL